ncbi:MAG: sel1 repeat family protein [Rickettsiales bacterium]|nr:sel1 repeat family protein [Rickettsiales bacterium]
MSNPRSWKEIVAILIIVPALYYVGIVYYTNLNKSCAYSVNKALRDPAYSDDIPGRWLHLDKLCSDSISEEFAAKELYSYYKMLKYFDQNILPEDKGDMIDKPDYYSELFFANLYGDNKYAEELKELEDSMSDEELREAFYIVRQGYLSNKTSHQEIYGYFKMKDHMNKNVFGSQDHMSYLAEHHKYLYYANVHGEGVYSEELKAFENSMTRDEKMEAFGVLGVILTNPDFLKYTKAFDYEKAFEYTYKAANLGEPGSQLSIGSFYATGKFEGDYPMTQNLILAYKWVYLSAYLGRERSKPGLEIIKKAIIHRKIPGGIEQGQALADEWLEQNKEWLKTRDLKDRKRGKNEL